MTRARRLIVVGVAVLSVLACPSSAKAQDVQRRLPAFQAPASDSLQSEMLSRLSQTGQFQPGDLARLARLNVLNSIAMLVNVRTDLPDSPLGNRLDQEITALWYASEAFYEAVSSGSLDAAGLARAQYWLVATETARREIEVTLGQFPGLSERAAENLQSVSRLLPNMGSALGIVEANVASAGAVPPEPSLSREALRREAQIVANLLVALIGQVDETGRGRPGRDALMTELTDMLDRLQGFARLLPLQPSFKEIQTSYQVARRQMWRAEQRILHVTWAAPLERPWRAVRERMNGISDQLGLPRVIVPSPAPGPVGGTERVLAAHVDHAVAWLDEFLAAGETKLRKTPGGPRFLEDVVRLRSELLQLRRRALAGETADRLSGSVQTIDRINQTLSDRAAELLKQDASDRGVAGYKTSADAIRKIGGVVLKK